MKPAKRKCIFAAVALAVCIIIVLAAKVRLSVQDLVTIFLVVYVIQDSVYEVIRADKYIKIYDRLIRERHEREGW